MIRVDRRARIVTRRLGASALLGGSWLRPRGKAGNLQLELAPVARLELEGRGLERLAGNRAQWGPAYSRSVTPASVRDVEFSRELRDDVLAGDITLSVRLWKRPQVKEGGRYRVGPGLIEIDADRARPVRGDHRGGRPASRRARPRDPARPRRARGADRRGHPRLPDRAPRGEPRRLSRGVRGSAAHGARRPPAPDGVRERRAVARTYRRRSRRRTRLGLAAVSANDHFLYQAPWLDGPTALATVIERSGAMELATTVALVALRGPVPLAKTLAALDVLSDGRVVAGRRSRLVGA